MNKRLNRIYANMKDRCYNPNRPSYKDYGARGITICKEWLDKEIVCYPSTKGWLAFEKWALSNGYADNLTIDRIDNNKGYSPENCRWTTHKVQSNNNRHNRLITYKGKTQTMVQWSEELKISYETLVYRIHIAHWDLDKTFTTPENADYRMITYQGKTQSLAEWCRELNMKYQTVKDRLNRYHWTIERAFAERNDARKVKRSV